MRLSSYLTEGRSVVTDKATTIAWLKKNFVPTDTPIYRGVDESSSVNYYMVNPSKHERESRNTDNYYTLLIDNSPNWTKYPKRSKSIVCTTCEGHAHGYGITFRIIPKKGSKIGVCSDCDFWESFPKLMNLENFNYFLRKLFTLEPSMDKNPQTYQELTRNFRTFDYWVREVMNDIDANIEEGDDELTTMQRLEIVKDGTAEFIRDALMYHPSDPDFGPKNFLHNIVELEMPVLEALEESMRPGPNKFELQKAGAFKAPDRNEVWTDGECLMVPMKRWDQIYSEEL